MLKCIDFLSRPDCLETEGIFRRSANAALIKELQVCNTYTYLLLLWATSIMVKTFFTVTISTISISC